MKFRLFLCCTLFLFLLSGACASKPASVVTKDLSATRVVVPDPPVALLPELTFDGPQLAGEAVPVSDQVLLPPVKQAALHDQALKRFFRPWRMQSTSLTAGQAFWGVQAYGGKQGYAENLQPYPRERWNRIVALQNMDAYPAMQSAGIITRNTAARVLPTLRPFFLDPTRPGQGFPFDYFQNSALWLGTPVFVAHVSSDRAWYLVETAFVHGWVRVEDVALAGKDFCAAYESRHMAALLLDDTSLLADSRFLGQTHIGAIFPIHKQSGGNLWVKVPVRGANNRAEMGLAQLNSLQAAPMPLSLTSRAVARLADAMSGQLYGWGGMFENRDCSSTMRDLFLPFGIWLSRNSAQQAKEGRVISLNGLKPEAKLATIRDQGVPFASLIRLPGHIGLYLGMDKRGEPLMLHNLWGVRTVLPDGGEGRAVAGKLSISTLRPGENRSDVRQGAYLERVRSLTVLGGVGDPTSK
jgi:hypothetical protein